MIRLYQDALKTSEVTTNLAWESEIRKYLDAIEKVHYQPMVFTTHEKALQIGNPKIGTYVFDEDVFGSLVRITVVRKKDAIAVRDTTGKGNGNKDVAIHNHLDGTLQSGDGIVCTIQPMRYSQKALHKVLLAEQSVSSPVEALFTGLAYLIEGDTVYVLEREHLREDHKYVILSATANETIYRKLFGDRLEFVDLSGTQQQGKLILHPERSYSKSSIQGKTADFVSAVVRDVQMYTLDGIICFKDLAVEKDGRTLLKGTEEDIPVLATFGALEGSGLISGKEIGGIWHSTSASIRLQALCVCAWIERYRRFCRAHSRT